MWLAVPLGAVLLAMLWRNRKKPDGGQGVVPDPARGPRLALAFEAMSEGAALVEEGGRVLHRNETGRLLFGALKPDAVLPDRLSPASYGLRHVDGHPVDLRDLPVFQALSGQTVVPLEAWVRTPLMTEPRVMRFNARLLPGEPRVAVVVYSDVTAEVRLREGLNDYAATIAHDLTHSLNAVKGWADQLALLARTWGDTEECHLVLGLVARMRLATGSATGLVGGLLAQAEDCEPSARLVDLPGLVACVAARWDHLGPDGPVITCTGETRVRSDALMLERALDHLLGWAVAQAPSPAPAIVVRATRCSEGAVVVAVEHPVGPAPSDPGAARRAVERLGGTLELVPADARGVGCAQVVLPDAALLDQARFETTLDALVAERG